jgi:hypothetical protein
VLQCFGSRRTRFPREVRRVPQRPFRRIQFGAGGCGNRRWRLTRVISQARCEPHQNQRNVRGQRPGTIVPTAGVEVHPWATGFSGRKRIAAFVARWIHSPRGKPVCGNDASRTGWAPAPTAILRCGWPRARSDAAPALALTRISIPLARKTPRLSRMGMTGQELMLNRELRVHQRGMSLLARHQAR